MHLRSLLITAACIVILAPTAWAGESGATLVRDIDAAPQVMSSDPHGFKTYGALTLFFAYDPVHGKELWRTDGTEAGTQLVRDLHPGAEDEETTSCMVDVGGALLFSTEDPYEDGGAIELWRTDGTADGTLRVREIPGSLDLNEDPIRFCQLVAGGGNVFFLAFEVTPLLRFRATLWKSDGTSEGTVAVRTFSERPRPFDTAMVASNGLFFFRAWSPGAGLEPWRSDGTADGTFLLADIQPGEDDSFPFYFVAIDDGACFSAQTDPGPPSIRHLWCSDGSIPGTRRVVQIGEVFSPGPSFEGHLFFQSAVEDVYGFWKTDGTEEATQLVRSGEVEAGVFGGALYIFERHDGGVRLLRSDGTALGTVAVAEFPTYAGQAFVADESLLFIDWTPSGARELWTSDLTSPGTRAIGELGNATVAGYSNGIVYLVNDDPQLGREPWIFDGSMPVPRLLKNIASDGVVIQECPGDCDGDDTVTINELITVVRLALGDVGSCAAVDRDADGVVSIAEVVAAVGAALGQCSS